MFKKLKGKVESSILYSRIEAEMSRVTHPVKNKVKKEIAYAKEHPVKATVNVATTAVKIYATAQATTLPTHRMLRMIVDSELDDFVKEIYAKSAVKQYVRVFGINYAAEKINDYNNELNNKNSKFNAVNNIITTNMVTKAYKCYNQTAGPILWAANNHPDHNLLSATKLMLNNPNGYIPEVIDLAISAGAYTVNKSKNKKEDKEIDFDKLLPYFNN